MPRYFLSNPPTANLLFMNVLGKGRVVTKDYKQWRNGEAQALMAQRARPIIGPIRLKIKVQDNKRRDLDNYTKPLIDLLVSNGLIDGDGWKTVKRIELEWADILGVEIEVIPA